jgi:hypothetical protein
VSARPPDAAARRDLVLAAGLALAVIVSRLPFAGAVLYHWDSINFALALSRFDVRAGQPHVPGYPLYVLLGRAVNLWASDPQRALVAISAVSSGLAVAALFALGRTMFDRATGAIAALLFAASPLFWFYGAIALPHCLDALMVIGAVWFLYRIQMGAVSLTVPAALWLAIAGGLRPQTEIFLAPLALYTAWHLDWRRRALGVAVLVALDLLWFIPLIELNGGWSAYMATVRDFDTTFTDSTSVFAHGGWFGLVRNLTKLGMYTLYGLGGALVLLPIAVVARWRAGSRAAGLAGPRAVTIALWVAPCVAYYTLVHMGQQGLVFVFLPALLLVLARAACTLSLRAAGWATGLAVLAGAALFIAAPTFPLGGDRLKLLTADTLRRHDATYVPKLAAVASDFAPADSAILSSGWRFAQYYLPQFPLLRFGVTPRWERGEGAPTRTDRTWVDLHGLGLTPGADGHYRVIVLDDELAAFNATPARAEIIRGADGTALTVMRIAPDERLYLGPDGFAVVTGETLPRQ